ncbi:MAG: site-2 protease family protein [Geminicoccaceae bacterium]
MIDLAEIARGISVWALPVLFAITFHEAAHGWMAERLGDDTARQQGRVSFNPLVHVDRFGTIVLPAILLLVGSPFLFGYAKPVPVAFHRLHNPKQDMIWVALAGPGINILMALAAAILMQLIGQLQANGITLWVWENLRNAILVNVVLACFNMLPIPPLDGGRVVTGLLPRPYAWKYAQIERYGLLIVLGLAIIVPMIGEQLGQSWNPLSWVLLPMVEAVHTAVLRLTGW